MGFDPDGTQYMPYRHLSEFLDVLEAPLQIAKPNKFKIIHMDIPICRWTNPESGEVKECMSSVLTSSTPSLKTSSPGREIQSKNRPRWMKSRWPLLLTVQATNAYLHPCGSNARITT